MTRLSHRLQKLERKADLTRGLAPLTRLIAALDEAAFRLAGCDFDSLSAASRELVFKDAAMWANRGLSDAERADLMEELVRIAFGDDIAARAAAEREANEIALTRSEW